MPRLHSIIQTLWRRRQQRTRPSTPIAGISAEAMGFAAAVVGQCATGAVLATTRYGCLRRSYRHSSRRVVASPPFRSLLVVRAQRDTWLPGVDPPAHLNGTLVGDYGFDPLGLGEDPKSLKWYVQAELVHCRFAMAGVAGILFTDLLRVTGMENIPVWYEAGAMKYDFANTTTLFIVQLILMGFVESKRYMDIINPGSQADGPFFGMEDCLEGIEPGYPGGPLFNPLGLAKDPASAYQLKLKEIKNGRLAMVAMIGFFVQANVTHSGPIDNLVKHLFNPWHTTIIQTLAGSAS